MTKIAVVGCKSFENFKWIKAVLDTYEPEPFILVSGGAKGVDTLGEEYAKVRGLETIVFPAQWKRYGKAAGPIRNKQIVDASDRMYAFWDCKSSGTRNSIGLAKKKGIPLFIIDIRNATPVVTKG